MTTSFMAVVLPLPGRCRAGMKGGDSLFMCVCGGGCVNLPGKTGGRDHERKKQKQTNIKIVQKTIKFQCAQRPCGSDCTSHSSLASSIASSPL